MKCMLKVFGCAGFRVRSLLMDGEFENLKLVMPSIECNKTVAKEHASEAKRTIRTLKEQIRGPVATLPFKCMPRWMKI